MKTKYTFLPAFLVLLSLFLFGRFSDLAAQTTYTWTGGTSGDFGNSANWSVSAPPSIDFTGSLLFIGSPSFTNISITGASFRLYNDITFGLAADNFTLAGTDTVALGGGINTLNGSQSITAPLLFVQAQSLSTAVGSQLSIGGSVNLGANITVDGHGTTQITGAVSGPGGITKDGSGTLTLNNTGNSFSGDLTINEGRLIGNALSLRGGISDSTTITNNSELEFNQSALGHYYKGISGTGSIIKSGSGSLRMTGINTHTGGTTVQVGTLETVGNAFTGAIAIESGATLSFRDGNLNSNFGSVTFGGSTSGAGDVLIDLFFSSQVFSFTGSFGHTGLTSVSSGNLSGSFVGATLPTGTIQLFSGGTLTSTESTSSSTGVVVTGNGNWVKNGAGTLTLTSNQSHTGVLSIQGGGLQLGGGANQLGSSVTISVSSGASLILNDSNQVIGGLNGSGNVVTSTNSSVLTLTGSGSHSGVISGTSSLVIQGGQTLTGNNSYSGGTTITGSGFLSGTGGVGIKGNIVNNGNLRFTNSSGAFNDQISGTGTVRYFGSANNSTLSVGGSSSYNGSTVVERGTLRVTNSAALGSGTTVTVQENAIFSGDRASLELEGVTLSKNLTVTGTGVNGDGIVKAVAGPASTVNGTVAMNGSTVAFGGDGTLNLTGTVSGSSALQKVGTGTLRLTGTNTYTGGTQVSEGTLSGTTNSIKGDVAVAASSTLRFDQTATATFANAISGAGEVIKAGTGAVTLSANNTYTGPTTVEEGLLSITGSIVSSVTVEDGGVLGGNGTVIGNVSILNGGTVAAGTSPGTLTVTGSFTLADTANLDFELDTPNVFGSGVNDLISVSGNLTLNGVLNIIDLAGFNIGTYRLFNYGGTLTNNGLVIGSAPGGFTYNIVAGGGAVDLQVIPEPSTWALLILAGCVAVFQIRRQHLRARLTA